MSYIVVSELFVFLGIGKLLCHEIVASMIVTVPNSSQQLTSECVLKTTASVGKDCLKETSLHWDPLSVTSLTTYAVGPICARFRLFGPCCI